MRTRQSLPGGSEEPFISDIGDHPSLAMLYYPTDDYTATRRTVSFYAVGKEVSLQRMVRYLSLEVSDTVCL